MDTQSRTRKTPQTKDDGLHNQNSYCSSLEARPGGSTFQRQPKYVLHLPIVIFHPKGNPEALQPGHLTQPTPHTSHPPRQLQIFRLDSHTFRMYGAEIGIFEKMHQERLSGFL